MTLDIPNHRMITAIIEGKQTGLSMFGFHAPISEQLLRGSQLEGDENMPVNMSEIDGKIGKPGTTNFVKLVAGRPKVLRIEDVNLTEIEVDDEETGIKKVSGILCGVVMEDGNKCTKDFTITSKKLVAKLKEDFVRKTYLKKDLKITKFGSSYDTDYEIEWLER